MDVEQRLAAICRRMREEKLELIVGLHDGAHSVEKPNAVMILCGFKSLGPAAAMLRADGRSDLIVTPPWDAARAIDEHPGLRVIGTTDLAEGIRQPLRSLRDNNAVGAVGLSSLPSHIAARVAAVLPSARPVESILFEAARIKTETEIECAREAARIAERGYRRLVDIARPGTIEDDLAVELKWYMKSMGAEDNCFLLCSGPQHRALQPSTGRRLQRGDIVLASIMPSYHGQLARLSRTLTIGPPSEVLAERHALMVAALEGGIAAAVAGAAVGDVCRAIDGVFDAAGHGEYCQPPHAERRGHGLGFASLWPGDVVPDNGTRLEPDTLLMIQANQFFPETGYLACGEPVLITQGGPAPLVKSRPELASVGT